jgi:hypothetical protein
MHRVEIQLVRVYVTLVSVIITLISVKSRVQIIIVSVVITIRVEITLCVYKSHSSVSLSHS